MARGCLPLFFEVTYFMAIKKEKTVFFCSNCGNENSKWLGQCPACHAWNTFVEERVKATSVSSSPLNSGSGLKKDNKAMPINKVAEDKEDRTIIGISEMDRVLGGGLVRGSLSLIGGDPGIGKSTLLLQVCHKLSAKGIKVLYISGEESARQIKMRANRIGEFNDLMLIHCETDLENILSNIRAEKPEVVVIDSIQTMQSEMTDAPLGSVSQIREATAALLRVSKGMNISVFIVGHVTKEGTVAGPRVLEHMVDTVLYFEGDRYASYRILRAVKNRFGATDEIGVFEMGSAGLTEVANPSEYMLSGRPEDASGALVSCCMEGSRPILVEVQALVSRTNFGYPRRQANGTDSNRLNMLMAVLEKRVSEQIAECDAYVNVAGGMSVKEPSLDLAIVIAIASSLKGRAVDDKCAVFGEVGLSGEVRSVSSIETRIREAKKMGFTSCVIPQSNKRKLTGDFSEINIIGVKNVKEAIAACL